MHCRNKSLLLLLCLLSLQWFFAAESRSEFYKYTDDAGRTFFVDDPSKIPPEYRQEVKAYEQKYDDLSEEERSVMLEKERQELEKFRTEEIARARAYVSRETKVIVNGNQVLVPVLLGYDGREVESLLLLDTGASIMALHRDVAQLLRIESFEKAKARVIGGREINADIAELSYVRVGPHKKEHLLAGIVDHEGAPVEYQGLLGMNFLKGLEYNIDFTHQRIEWKR
jgi:predicted aspartyl protease